MTQEQLLDLYPKEANIDRYIAAVNNKISAHTQSDTQLTPKHCELAIWALKKDLEKVPTGSPLWQHITCLISLMNVTKELLEKALKPLSDQLKELANKIEQQEKTLERMQPTASLVSDRRTTIINAQSVTVAEMHHNDKNNTRIH